MTQAVEVPYEQDITPERFWELAHELLYTKLYYDVSKQEYYTKPICREAGHGTSSSGGGEANSEDSDVDAEAAEELARAEFPDVQELENSLPCTEQEMNTLLVSYLTLVSNYCDQLSEEPNVFFNSVSHYILDCGSFKENETFCIRKMISLLYYGVNSNEQNMRLDPSTLSPQLRSDVDESIGTNEKFIKTIGWILYCLYCEEGKPFLTLLDEYKGTDAIIEVLNNYAQVSRNVTDGDPFIQSYSNYMALFYDLCQKQQLTLKQLDGVSNELMQQLLKNLRAVSEEDDPLNYLRFKLLLALNEQFLVQQYSNPTPPTPVTNRAFKVITKDKQLTQNFLETLILNFNRECDPTVLILMLKMFYVIFTTSSTCHSIYLNDLKVIVDIIIRELCNLSLVRDVSLVNTNLRVLYPLLHFSNLKGHSYKTDSMRDVLKYLSIAEQASDTTKRLANRCLDLQVFQEPSSPSPAASDSEMPFPGNPLSSLNTDANVSSMSLPANMPGCSTGGSSPSSPVSRFRSGSVLPPPPPPPPRGGHRRASMVSNLSSSSAPSAPSSRQQSISSEISVVSDCDEQPYRPLGRGYSVSSASSSETVTSRRSRGPAPPPPPRRRAGASNSSDISLSRAKVTPTQT